MLRHYGSYPRSNLIKKKIEIIPETGTFSKKRNKYDKWMKNNNLLKGLEW